MPSHTRTDTTEGTPRSIFEQAKPVPSVESIIRMYFLDAALRLKLRSLFAAGLPVVLDAWRTNHDMDGVVASGIWPFIGYVDLEVGDIPLAGGSSAEFRTAIRTGRISSADRSDGMLVTATEVAIYGQRGGGQADNFMHAAAGAERERAGCMRVMCNLVRPMAAPEERAVRTLPSQLAGVDVAACAPAPSTAELLRPPADHALSAQAETHARWAQHHTDANQLVYSAEYIAYAEDLCGELIHRAGLPPAGLRMSRGQLAPKRPFFAGQEYWVRGQLHRSADGARSAALISFHGASAPGVIDERPCTAVRIDFH